MPRAAPSQSVSVAYWPNARRIAPALEERFHNRIVYLTVLPTPVAGAPDWVMWFAEQEQARVGQQAVMRPPVAILRLLVDPSTLITKVEISGMLLKTGKLDLSSAGPTAVKSALEKWLFTPATRNGIAVDVEVVIQIPAAPAHETKAQ